MVEGIGFRVYWLELWAQAQRQVREDWRSTCLFDVRSLEGGGSLKQ